MPKKDKEGGKKDTFKGAGTDENNRPRVFSVGDRTTGGIMRKNKEMCGSFGTFGGLELYSQCGTGVQRGERRTMSF